MSACVWQALPLQRCTRTWKYGCMFMNRVDKSSAWTPTSPLLLDSPHTNDVALPICLQTGHTAACAALCCHWGLAEAGSASARCQQSRCAVREPFSCHRLQSVCRHAHHACGRDLCRAAQRGRQVGGHLPLMQSAHDGLIDLVFCLLHLVHTALPNMHCVRLLAC